MAPAWWPARGSSAAYRKRLLADGTAAIAELGTGNPRASTWWWLKIRRPSTIWSSAPSARVIRGPCLALPPTRYKSAPYRSRAVIDPRGVLREFGVTLADDVQVRVWDSTAEIRYLVLPERPPGTERMTEEQLAALVTRNAMVGVANVANPRRSRRMNSIHDMGGMHGMGPIEVREDERPFHAEWEGRAWGLVRAAGPFGPARRRNFRYEHEVLPPAQYLQMQYDERFIKLLVDRLIAAKLLTQAELDSGRADPGVAEVHAARHTRERRRTARPASIATAGGSTDPVTVQGGPTSACSQHQPGRAHSPAPLHAGPSWNDCDGPRHLRFSGHRRHAADRPQHVYTVSFSARELWGDTANARDNIHAELWEDYLERA